MNNNKLMEVTGNWNALSTTEIKAAINELNTVRKEYARILPQQLLDDSTEATATIVVTSFMTDTVKYLSKILADRTTVSSQVINMGGNTMVLFIEVECCGINYMMNYYDDDTLYVYEDMTVDKWLELNDSGESHDIDALDQVEYRERFDYDDGEVRHKYYGDKLEYLFDIDTCDKIMQIVINYDLKY